MNKLFLLIIFAVLLYLVFTRSRRSSEKREDVTPSVAETMIQCARCGLHLPQGEGLPDGDLYYCCEEHRRLGRG